MIGPTATIELIWQDETGSTAISTFHLPNDATMTEIEASIDLLASILSSLTRAVLVGSRVKYRSLKEETVSAGGSTPITATGVFFFSTIPDTPDGSIVVHAIKPSKLVHIGPTSEYAIDLTDSDVIAFADAVTSGPICNPFGDDFTALISAYLQRRV